MGVVKLSTAGILDYQKYSSFLAGNAAYSPGSYDLIQSEILTSSQASVTFDVTGLGSTYQHLQIRLVGRGSAAVTSTSLRMKLNSSTSGYAGHYLDGDGSTVTSGAYTSQALARLGRLPAASSTANIFGANVTDLLDAFSTSKYKVARSLGGSAGYNYLALQSSLWQSTSALTGIEIFLETGNFVTGSRFSIYGLRSS